MDAMVPSSLEILHITYAEEQYGDFVDVYGPVLTMSEFQKRRNLPLNEQCCSVFYSKIAHLNDNDFVEIDRSILETIGFKNTFYEVKDKKGAVKVDKDGNSKVRDARSDFYQAIRCLRNTAGFVEGSSFDDTSAHFVIHKHKKLLLSSQVQHGGHNKQSLWIRKRALEHFILMANTCNSFMIREFFLDLKRVIMEYNSYQTVYRSKLQLCMKDSKIDQICKQMEIQSQQLCMKDSKIDKICEQLNVQSEQLNVQTQKLEMLSNLLLKETDNKVIDVEEKQKKQELVVLRNKNEPTQIEVLRGQLNHVNQQLKRKRNDIRQACRGS